MVSERSDYGKAGGSTVGEAPSTSNCVHGDTPSKGLSRNSSIELLRIVAMFMILVHHFIMHNAYDWLDLSPAPLRLFVQVFLVSSGKIGAAIFFVITAWFFVNREQRFKTCVSRVWQLEKEILFYSVLLAVGFFLMDRHDIGNSMFIHSFLPLTWNVWWYPTAYATFLLLLPFLWRGLHTLGKRAHFGLCVTMLFLYGFIGLIPGTMNVSGVWEFVYLFVLVSAYRWYLEEHVRSQRRLGWVLVGIGMAVVLVYAVASLGTATLTGGRGGTFAFVTDDTRLPVVFVALGMFLVFEDHAWHNWFVNLLAGSAFAVYLITDYPPSRAVLWSGSLDLRNAALDPLWLLWALGVCVCIYTACTAIDLLRRAIFSKTIDVAWGGLFERLWTSGVEYMRRAGTFLDFHTKE